MIVNEKSNIKKRESNLELFRIIVMILIVAHHYVVNSSLMADGEMIMSNPLSWRSIFLLLFGAWGKIGINCFVLITGYFMCKSKITLKKFCKLLFEIMFYRIVISSIFWISGYSPFSFKGLIKVLIPIMTIGDNFASAFLVFFLTIPFLNILVRNLKERQHILLLVLSFFLYVFLGTVPYFSVTMNYVSWFIVLYFISSYISLHSKRIFESAKVWGVASIICILLSVGSVVACAWASTRFDGLSPFYFVTDSNTFLAVATGLSLFMFFKNIKMKPNRFINAVAATTFGVLLIHANSDAMRQWLWVDLLKNVNMYSSSWMPLHAIGSVIGVFVVCSIIDFIRIMLIERPFFKLINPALDKISIWGTNTYDKFCNRFNIE